MEVKLLIDSFYTETSKDVEELNKTLRERILEDYADVKSKKERYKKLLENEFFNALQVKFAYAVTCHKAQGGQWDNVFVDQGFVSEQMVNTDYYRWLYTAFTRAKQQLFLVNFSEKYF
jgi:exodeoxyribonuclease-5